MPRSKTINIYETSENVKHKSPDTLILIHKTYIRNQVPESEMKFLSDLLFTACNPEQFCIAHELVDRNKITSQKRKILKESLRLQLRPFRFLINKN